jgi:hypothetical protein
MSTVIELNAPSGKFLTCKVFLKGTTTQVGDSIVLEEVINQPTVYRGLITASFIPENYHKILVSDDVGVFMNYDVYLTVQNRVHFCSDANPDYVPPNNVGIAELLARLTHDRAANLDNLDASVSSRATALKLALVEDILRGKTVTDPETGLMTVFDSVGDVLFTARIYEDAEGTVPYRGLGVNLREYLE